MLRTIDFWIIISSVFLIIISKIFSKRPKPIFNIYQKPNGFFWLKTLLMFLVLKLRTLKKKDDTLYEKIDGPQNLSSHEKAIDAVYFNGASENGDYFVIATARRKNKLIDGFLYVKINSSGHGVLCHPKLPGTDLHQNEDEEGSYKAEGIQITPITPMKCWNISYNGILKNEENDKVQHEVKFNLTWTSDLPIFNFDTDMEPLAMAKSMAYENWSREYFENLKQNHQTHYEQHGQLNGIVEIDNIKYQVDLNTLRDHSFGLQREWRTFHRYGLHFFSAANGDRFSVGMICLPVSFSRFTMGYVYCKKDQKIYPVKTCDLQLYQHGEDGRAPLDYAFSFEAGGKFYTVQVDVLHSPHLYISKDWESKVVERLCTFTINGVKGWGAAEWQYRNIQGRAVKN